MSKVDEALEKVGKAAEKLAKEHKKRQGPGGGRIVIRLGKRRGRR